MSFVRIEVACDVDRKFRRFQLSGFADLPILSNIIQTNYVYWKQENEKEEEENRHKMEEALEEEDEEGILKEEEEEAEEGKEKDEDGERRTEWFQRKTETQKAHDKIETWPGQFIIGFTTWTYI